MLMRAPNPFQLFAATCEPLHADDPFPHERWWPPTPASTLRNREWRARLRLKKNDPGRIIRTMFHDSEINAMSLAMSGKPRDRDKPIEGRAWHDDVSATVKAFVLAELKRRKLI